MVVCTYVFFQGSNTNYGEFTKLKEKYPNLKTSISVGGYGEGAYKFSQLVEKKYRRDLFVSSLTSKKYVCYYVFLSGLRLFGCLVRFK